MTRYILIKRLTLFAIFILFLPFIGQAQSSEKGASNSSAAGEWYIVKKAEVREQSRWSLESWLAQRDRNRLMDLWLAMHSPSPYEFKLGGSYNSYSTTVSDVSSSNTSYSGNLSAYAEFIGLSAEYENNTAEQYNDLAGMLNVRLLGNSLQNTSFTIHYGQRTHSVASNNTQRVQQFGQVSLQVYLTRHFGLTGEYRYYLPMNQVTIGSVNENASEAGIFIDFKALRIFGNWFHQQEQVTPSGATSSTNTDRVGIRSGLEIYF